MTRKSTARAKEKRTTVRLPDELMRRAKRYAADKGTTVTALMEDGLRYVLNERDHGATKPRNLPRVSQAGRGQPATVGLPALKALQEDEDMEYFERMKRGFNDPG